MSIIPNLRNIEVQVKNVRPGVTMYKFKNFEDMGNYYMSRMDEIEARGQKVITVGIAMFIHDKRGP